MSNLECPVVKIQSGNIILISDIHFGWNVSSEEWQNNINSYFRDWFLPYVDRMKEKYPDVVVCCLGDVYNDEKSIEIVVMNQCADFFEQIAEKVPVYIINGNHDLSKMNRKYSSLRTLDNAENVTIFKTPTLLQFMDGRKNIAKIAAIPYLGDCNKENKELVRFSGTADYAFMHTDISQMKFDNGMTIVGAVDAEKFAGKIISGHIHKRQESKNVLYVGSPYQLSRGDIDNVKGIYHLDLRTGEMNFTENDYSPVFKKIDISQLMNFTDSERESVLKGNYVEVLTVDNDIEKYKLSDVYDILNKSGAKKSQVVQTKTKNSIKNEKGEVEYKEMNMNELIESAIDQLKDIDDDFKQTLKNMSNEYYKNAIAQLDNV